ncbi:MAG: Transcriptional regulator, CdaR [Xylanivirga thermophila]|uniref:CdaR family transcriptional regulator n=1 Tax=Xylanivirga thermophila TaxID=2496273 RepID=UPI0039F63FD7
MIEVPLAKKFIEQVTQYTDYNINIMDHKGIIIASSDPKRVGSFHQVAYNIVNGTDDIVETFDNNDYPGVLPGINMVIKLEGKREGCVGITGSPDEIKPIALITKMAIEAMLAYEKQKEAIYRRQNRKEYFRHMLTDEGSIDPNVIRALAKELLYSEDIIRIPILCRTKDPETKMLLEMIKSNSCHSLEDISFVIDEEHILIFKTMPQKGKNIFAEYKYIIADYLSPTLKWLREHEKGYKLYIGTFQSSFSQYYFAYQHCKWLECHINTKSTAEYFYDHVGQYINSVIPRNELQRIFNVHDSKLSESFKQNYIEMVGHLINNNYNMVATAEQMYIHKNTLLYRYNKMRSELNLNPQASSYDRRFMDAFYIYLNKNQYE